jgi:hypothetical protein
LSQPMDVDRSGRAATTGLETGDAGVSAWAVDTGNAARAATTNARVPLISRTAPGVRKRAQDWLGLEIAGGAAQRTADFLDHFFEVIVSIGQDEERNTGGRGFLQPRRVLYPGHDEVGPERFHHSQGFVDAVCGRHREPQLREYRFASRTVLGVFFDEQHERGEARSVTRAAAATRTASSIGPLTFVRETRHARE